MTIAPGLPPAAGLRLELPGAAGTVFDPALTPLEDGVTLVEASAGTGKTFCITVAVVRLVLERVDDVARLLVVTFTNAATDELVTRIRSALRTAVDVFSGDPIPRTPATEVWFALRDRYGDGGLERLRRALERIDQLSVFTIHGFCKRVLEESALETGTPYGAEFVEDDGAMLERAAHDWWRRTFYEDPALAAMAVANRWTPDAFITDFRRWRRHPRTTVEPAAPALAVTRDVLARARDAVMDAWDEERVGGLLDAITWNKDAPLGRGGRAAVRGWMRALIEGHLDALVRLEACGVDQVTKWADKRKKQALAPVAGDPFFVACSAIAPAVELMRAAVRADFFIAVTRGFEDEKDRRHALGFDDLLRRLHAGITAEEDGGALARAIRDRYDAALIDEFQDTDPFQFPIFSTAFRGRPLFLIGDPKQAIYGFRGADIFAYASAVKRADRRYTLVSNWRSTEGLIGGVNALFARGERAFLRPGAEIGFSPASAAAPGPCPMDDSRPPLQWWFVSRDGSPWDKGEARALLQRRTAQEVRLLLEGCRVEESGRSRDIVPSDIAVLVRTHYEAAAVQRELRSAGIPSTVASTGDILASGELHEVERILRAIAAPQDGDALRAALATELWGWPAHRIRLLSTEDGEAEWADLLEEVAGDRESWVRQGFMRMMRRWLARRHVAERLLRLPDGQRRLTNLRHAVELLHGAAEAERLSPDGLLAWIANQRGTPVGESGRRELRLETDADAVQIVTIHKCKGLEYGIVFCNCLWETRGGRDEAVLVHEDDGMVLDFGSPDQQRRKREAASERAAEELRLAYVALTRAKWRCYVGWGVIKDAGQSALGWLLRPDTKTTVDASCEDLLEAARAGMGPGGEWLERLQAFAATHPRFMECHLLDDEVVPGRWTGREAAVAAAPSARRFTAARQLVRLGTASFTSLIRGHEGHVGERDVSDPAAVPAAAAAPEGIFAFARGRRTGDLLHAVFEHVDFRAVGAPATRTIVEQHLSRDPRVAGAMGTEAAVQAILDMLRRVTAAPLPGPGFALRDVPMADTLREWRFVLPLAPVTGRLLAQAFAAHAAPPLREYGARLAALSQAEVRGYLTGITDLAFTHAGRWYVTDWKSNHLGDSPERYDAAAIGAEMTGNHYLLQYHLYVLALHRHLGLRLPGYDYDRHMGGVWYAFVRGIDGSPHHGWWHDRPPRALIESLDRTMVQGALEPDVPA